MQISKRLKTVASMVTPGARVADIGCDHGFIPIWLIKNKIVPSAIAMDVRPGPLRNARIHIAEHGFEEQIELRLSDGMEKLQVGEADSVVIAGMGGQLIIHIVKEGLLCAKNVKELILSPQSDIETVRRFLAGEGFVFLDECMVLEDGKYYTIMKVVHQKPYRMSEAEYRYGRCLMKKEDPVLKEYLKAEQRQLEEVLNTLKKVDTEKGKARLNEKMAEYELGQAVYMDLTTRDMERGTKDEM